MRQIRERLEQIKQDLENHTIYKEGLPGSALDIGRYEADKDGGGAFFPRFQRDEERSYASFGLFVNAWMPLPEPYKEV